MGKSVGGVTLHPTAVQSVGLNLGLVDMHGEPNPHFREGGFELTLHEISTYERAISAHEMDTAAPAAAAPAAAPLEHEVQTDAGPGVQPAGLQHSVLARPRRRGRAKVGHPSVELPLHTLAAPGVASPL